MTTGATLIAMERDHQRANGRTAAHDDLHTDGSLVTAALVYADPGTALVTWPWDGLPRDIRRDRVTDLVKAGALIAAEIDRLLRAQQDVA